VIADTVAEMGADLILVDRPGSAWEPVQTALERRWSARARCEECDLEQACQREELVASVVQGGATLDVLINNAAFVGTADLAGWAVPLEQQRVDTWRRAVEVNLTAPFELCKSLAGAMRSSQGASIINVGSIYGTSGPDWRLYEGTGMGSPAAYAASKGGLIQLTRWLATTLAPHVRVNAISPGGVARNQPRAFVERYESRTPLGRMATEDDFRGAIAFLSSDLSRYMTGQNLMVDGGWSTW
jgi:NAD(P)-dependent dehydrogenase (short-subunit alcohol dehydrogenase family)